MKIETFTLGNFYVDAHTSDEYHVLKSEIFTKNLYYFETENPAPYIIDIGAHIGMSTLYFKKIYPFSEIVAVEPFKENIKLLKQNISQNGLDKVTVLEVAVTEQEGTSTIHADTTNNYWFSTASFHPNAWNGQQYTQPFKVPTISLSSLLLAKASIDLVKIDIEGIESRALFEAGDALKRVRHLFVEFHPTRDQDLAKLADLLRNYFDLTFWQDDKEIKRPKHPTKLLLIEGVTKDRDNKYKE